MNETEGGALGDREVVRLVRKGHTDYFRILVDRYQGRVFSIGLRFLRNRDDALDFSQDVFLKAFQALPSFRGVGRRGGSFAGWITRIAWRQGINSVQRRKNYAGFAEGYEPLTEKGPESEQLRRNIREALKDASRGLTEPQVMCLDLSFFFGLRYGDISEITGIPVNTVKSHVFRAKKILKDKLRGTDAEDYHDL